MTQVENVIQTALYLRELARASELPAYMEKLSRAAEELEQRAAELEYQPIAA